VGPLGNIGNQKPVFPSWTATKRVQVHADPAQEVVFRGIGLYRLVLSSVVSSPSEAYIDLMIGVGGGAAMEKRKIWAMTQAGRALPNDRGREQSPHIKGFELRRWDIRIGTSRFICVVSAPARRVGPIRFENGVWWLNNPVGDA